MNAILVVFTIIPGIAQLIMVLLCIFYGLEKKMPQILTELNERRDAQS